MNLKSFAILTLALLTFSATQLSAGDDAPAKNGKQGKHQGNHAALLGKLHQRVVNIGKRIDKWNEKLAEHPNCPEVIKNDINKLTGDLGTQKGNVGQLITDVQAKNKEACKADRATMKSQHQVIKGDREQLRTDRKACKAERQAAGQVEGAGKKHQGQHQGKHQGQKKN